jgi:hypothetical protein
MRIHLTSCRYVRGRSPTRLKCCRWSGRRRIYISQCNCESRGSGNCWCACVVSSSRRSTKPKHAWGRGIFTAKCWIDSAVVPNSNNTAGICSCGCWEFVGACLSQGSAWCQCWKGEFFYSKADWDPYTLLNTKTAKTRGRSVIILMTVTLTLRVEQWKRLNRGVHEHLSKEWDINKKDYGTKTLWKSMKEQEKGVRETRRIWELRNVFPCLKPILQIIGRRRSSCLRASLDVLKSPKICVPLAIICPGNVVLCRLCVCFCSILRRGRLMWSVSKLCWDGWDWL